MKIKLFFLMCTIVAFSSCADFLNYNESSSYGANDIFSVYTRASQMALNVYTYLPSDFNSVGGAMRSSGCDESEYVWPLSNIHVFYDGTWSAINTVDDAWGYNYSAIRAANLFLQNGVGQTFSENKYVSGYDNMMLRYNNLQYEVRFLRAYFYFELLKRYGGVPLVTKVLTPDEANHLSRDSYQKVSEFIVHECDTVATHLPQFYDAKYNAETGRVTRAAALALKARVLLYAASDLHNQPGTNELLGFTSGDQTQRWKDAASAAKVLIDSGTVFKINKFIAYDKIPNNIALPELIFANRLSNSGTFESLNYPIGFVGGNTGNCPTQNLVDAYEMKTTGAQFDWTNSTMTANPYTNRDPRLGLTVVLNNTTWVDNQVAQIWQGGNSGLPKVGATNTGYYIKKYIDKNISFQPSGVTSTRHVWVMFRYGEVILNYAEAMNEAFGSPSYTDGTFTLSAVAALNLLRSRSGLGLVAIPTTISTSDFRAKVRNERMVELAFEDHRFWDIRRWMIGPQTVAIKRTIITKDPVTGNFNYSTVTTHERTWNDKMYFYPIPQAEIYKDINLKQNQGW
jgi:hypothetical protein